MWMPLSLLIACTNEKPTVEETVDVRTLPVPENGYQLITPSYEVPSYTEIDLCTVMRLEPKEDERLYWVNRMESLVTEGTHHMNVLIGEFSFLDAFMEEGASENALGTTVGQYPCSELNIMEQAYTIFPSQRENQQITLPEGVAAPMMAPLLLVFSHHYINATETPIRIHATLNIETIDAQEVTDVAGLVFNDIADIEVPPGTDVVASRTCVFDRNVNVALVSSHNHSNGICATMNNYAGTSNIVESEPFFVNKLWDQPPILHFESAAFSLSAGDGIHWACHYRNPLTSPLINDGTADGEMCVFAAVTYPSLWTVEQVEETVDDEDLTALISLMGDIMGPCDSIIDTVDSPWDTDNSDSCTELTQTESNILE